MKKLLVPLVIALMGLGVGVGAGVVLRPGETELAQNGAAADACKGPKGAATEAPSEGEAAQPCETVAADPFAPVPEAPVAEVEGGTAYVAMEKPFVVPVFFGEKVAAMVVVSLSVETGAEEENAIRALEPRLRDSFLKVMFLHSNSGGFSGSFTSGQKMQDLKSALRSAAHGIVSHAYVGDVLITEIARQDV